MCDFLIYGIVEITNSKKCASSHFSVSRQEEQHGAKQQKQPQSRRQEPPARRGHVVDRPMGAAADDRCELPLRHARSGPHRRVFVRDRIQRACRTRGGGKVKSIEFGDTVFTITPVDGFTYTDDDGKRYDQNYTLFTTIIPDATENLITLCDEHGVTYTKPYQPPVSPILTFMVSYILPTVLMVGAFMLLMNFITKKSGGMGGIGGIGNVGKANAKVYMEKSTGVTFADVAGQDEAKEIARRDHRLSAQPRKNTPPSAQRSPRARCSSALPVPVKRCWPRPLRARRRCRSSRSPALTLSRCSSASARAACATSSPRRRRSPLHHLHRRDRHHRQIPRRRALRRRQRRARADAQPAARRNGRL